MIISPETAAWLDQALDWAPIGEYDGKSVVMLRSDEYAFMGMLRGKVWTELVDGQEIQHPGFEPRLWAPVSAEFEFDYAM